MGRSYAVGAGCRMAISLGVALAATGCGDDSSGDSDADLAGLDGGADGQDGSASGGDGDPGGAGTAETVVLLFGGDSGTETLGDTWTWDGQAWAGKLASTRPDPRRDHALAYDAARERAVLFGGADGSAALNDTWEWDGAAWGSAGSAPGDLDARSHHALVYDEARGQVVLFGGSAGDSLLGDTWLWDGEIWTEASVDDPISPRAGHAMAYDTQSEEIVLFGGDEGGPPALGDTWVRGAEGWVDVSPPEADSPSGRSGSALAYDPVRERVVLFGGSGGEGLLNDTWEWNGQDRTWTEIEVSGTAPTARSGHALVYDPVRQSVLLFGGTGDAGQPLSGTLEWNGSQWEQVSGGPARSGHALARAPGQ